eukprot:scaffold80037_cov14-Tisochrysis_lutea.AAC.1
MAAADGVPHWGATCGVDSSHAGTPGTLVIGELTAWEVWGTCADCCCCCCWIWAAAAAASIGPDTIGPMEGMGGMKAGLL